MGQTCEICGVTTLMGNESQGECTSHKLMALYEAIEFIDKKEQSKFLSLINGLRPDIYIAPAARGYHHHWRGGWLDHTLQVIDIAWHLFQEVCKEPPQDVTLSSVIKMALVHDLEKVGRYEWDEDKQKFQHKGQDYDASANMRTLNMLAKYGIYLSDIELNALEMAEGGYSMLARADHKARMSPLGLIIYQADHWSALMLKDKKWTYSTRKKLVDKVRK